MARAGRKAASATTKIDPDLLRKAKQVAALRDVRLTNYLDGLLRGPIERDHRKELTKIADEHQRPEGGLAATPTPEEQPS